MATSDETQRLDVTLLLYNYSYSSRLRGQSMKTASEQADTLKPAQWVGQRAKMHTAIALIIPFSPSQGP